VSVTLDCTSAPFVRSGKTELLTVAALVTRNASGAVLAPMAQSSFGGNLESAVRRSVLCWCVWQESGFSRHEDVFRFNLKKIIFANILLSMRFLKTIMQQTVLLFNTKKIIPVNIDGS
jgi:hypothetical protein